MFFFPSVDLDGNLGHMQGFHCSGHFSSCIFRAPEELQGLWKYITPLLQISISGVG